MSFHPRMGHFSIKSKLLAMLLGVSLISIALVATLNYAASHDALRESVFNQLTSLRASKADQIERYFEERRTETGVLAGAALVHRAATALIAAYAGLDDAEVPPGWDDSIRRFYDEEYLPLLSQHTRGAPTAERYLPQTRAARYLKYAYIAGNPFPLGAKDSLDESPEDTSSYAAAHRAFHPLMRNVVDRFGYYDAFLIDIETGDVVYSVRKETDFAANLMEGPYDTSNLAALFRLLQRDSDRGEVRIADFANYRPSYGRPAAFVGTTVFEGHRPIAVLAMQLSVDEINHVMTGGEQWERDGLGKTGETILVGPDYLMRSTSRFLVEDPDGYVEGLRRLATPDADIEQILALRSPILRQAVRTRAAEEGLRGQVGTGVIEDYRGVEILGSWAPLRIPDVRWAIVGKIDLEEAYAPIHRLARHTLVQTALIVLVITVVVMLLVSSFVRPVNELITRVRDAGSGAVDVDVASTAQDEIGDLARSFQDLLGSVREQTRLLEEVRGENQRLLESILPAGVVRRMRRGDDELADTVPDVSILFAEVNGLAQRALSGDAGDSVALLKRLVASFDEAAERCGVEKLQVVGDTYQAAAGLSEPLLDHARRAVDFARELVRIVRRADAETDAELRLRVGIASGTALADVIGRERLVFHVWGEVVIEADHARDEAGAWQVVVTTPVRDKLHEVLAFRPLEGATGDLPLWVLADSE